MKAGFSRFSKGIENFFYKIYAAIEKNRFLSSIKSGFILTIPIFIIGACGLAIQYFPYEPVRNFIATAANGSINSFLNFVNVCTYGMASLYILMAITFSYSNTFAHNSKVLICINAMVAFAGYILLCGIEPVDGKTVFDVSCFNVNNVFAAVLVAFLSTTLFFLFYRLLFTRRVYHKHNQNKNYQEALSSLLPMCLTLLVFGSIILFIKYVLHDVFARFSMIEVNSFSSLIIALLSAPFQSLGQTYGSDVLIFFLESVLWFFGIHGSNVFEAINTKIFAETNGYFLCKSFTDTFVLMGGCGTLICLLLALMIFSRKNRNASMVTKSSIVPMIFNINETMVFGLPVVLNPVLLIPFILVPFVCLTTSYFAVVIGILPETVSSVFWTTPVLLSGYQYTGSIMGMVVQLVNIVLGTLIYAPFVILNNRVQVRLFEDKVREMEQMIKETEASEKFNLLEEGGKFATPAGMLVNALKDDLLSKKVHVFYQPICNAEGKVISTEALLRWNYNFDRHIYPPLVIKLAKESGVYDTLTKYIIEQVLTDFASVHIKGISCSVNITVAQLNDTKFIDWFIEMLHQYKIPKKTITLEITEEGDFISGNISNSLFEKLEYNGIKISIDDFSMGQTSITYLQEHHFDFVKLDGSLVRKVNENENSESIIKSIIALSKKLKFDVIAECVESKEIQVKMAKLGAKLYQGYYYSKAINFDEYLEFVNTHNEATYKKGEK